METPARVNYVNKSSPKPRSALECSIDRMIISFHQLYKYRTLVSRLNWEILRNEESVQFYPVALGDNDLHADTVRYILLYKLKCPWYQCKGQFT